MNNYHPLLLGDFIDETPSLDFIKDEEDILNIQMISSKGTKYLLKFDSYLAFRKIPESYALIILYEIGLASSLKNHLFESTQSEFKNWFVSQSGPLSDAMNIINYTVTLENEVIEVLAEEPPQFVVLAQ